MLTDKETDALRRWYTQAHVLGEARTLIDQALWLELEELVQMRALVPLHRHSELPDFMLNDAGEPLFASNLNPRNDLEQWRDAVELGWKIIRDELGLSQDDVHRSVAEEQRADWDRFMESVEARRRERGLESDEDGSPSESQ